MFHFLSFGIFPMTLITVAQIHFEKSRRFPDLDKMYNSDIFWDSEGVLFLFSFFYIRQKCLI